MVLRQDEARMETADGDVLKLGRLHRCPYKIDPVNGLTINLQTTQGAGQVGATVDRQSAGGVYRRIRVMPMDGDRKLKKFLSSLRHDTKGTLYLWKKYKTDFVMSKLPDPDRYMDDIMTFDMQIFCPSPFWAAAKPTSITMGGYSKAFRIPVNYAEPHSFGRLTAGSGTVVNAGTLPAPYRAELRCETAAVEDPVLSDLTTGQDIGIHFTMEPGDIITISRDENNVVTADLTRGGITGSIFGKLDERSDFRTIAPGTNVLAVNSPRLRTTVTFNALYAGVWPDAT